MECPQYGSHEENCLGCGFFFFGKLSTNKKPGHSLVQVVMVVGVYSRTVPIRKLYVNIKIIYQLLLWMQLNQYLGTLLV